MAREIFRKGEVSTELGDDARCELVVLFHGLMGSPRSLEKANLIAAAAAGCPCADILAVPLPFRGLLGAFALRRPEDVAADVVRRIDAAVKARAKEGGRYRRIVLAGHSFGAVIARKVAIIANGERPRATFEPRLKALRGGKPWGRNIERIVLLAAMSRGWSPAAARDWLTAAFWSVGSLVGELMALVVGRPPTIFGIRQGAPFIIQTRLQWLALARSWTSAQQAGASPAPGASDAHPGHPKITVIQLLGAADDLVAPDDSVDFAIDTSTKAPFALVEVPLTGHKDAFQMARPSEQNCRVLDEAIAKCRLADACKESGLTRQARWLVFSRALSRSVDELGYLVVNPHHMADSPALQDDHGANHVVFVIHGIRDRGFWTQKIARVIKREAEHANAEDKRAFDEDPSKRSPEWKERGVRSFTGSYGYFAMVPFVLPWVRRWKAAWLMDRYTEACARFPDATFSYVGHSNGTYLLARALQDYPAVSFDRVVFAGSVVRRDFDWESLLGSEDGGEPKGRVKEVLNYVATRDWVVAIFPKGFQPLRFFFDLGSAGHDGFDQYKKPDPHPRLHEARCVIGSHSAALSETQWDDIAQFIVKGAVPPERRPDVNFKQRRSAVMVAMGWVSSLLLAALLWLVIGTGLALLNSITGKGEVSVQLSLAGLSELPQTLANGVCWLAQAFTRIVQSIPDILLQLWHGLLRIPELVAGLLAAFVRGVAAVLSWLGEAFQGRIVTPFDEVPGSPAIAAARAFVFAVYCWVVYVVATRL